MIYDIWYVNIKTLTYSDKFWSPIFSLYNNSPTTDLSLRLGFQVSLRTSLPAEGKGAALKLVFSCMLEVTGAFSNGNPRKMHGKFMGNPWEIHGKYMGNPWEIRGKSMEILVHVRNLIKSIAASPFWDRFSRIVQECSRRSSVGRVVVFDPGNGVWPSNKCGIHCKRKFIHQKRGSL